MDENGMQNVQEAHCGICGDLHEYFDCTLIQIKDKIRDNEVPSRARLTLPQKLRLEVMADGTYTVVTNEDIEKGTQFGPLEALKLFTLPPSIIFPLKVFVSETEDFTEYYLDTTNEDTCNWMIFVSPAVYSEEQNLICFQEKADILFMAIKDIPAGDFLKVWYSPYYAKKMNKTILSGRDNPENVKNDDNTIDLNKLLKQQQNIMDRESWTCKFCGKLETDVSVFAQHILEHYSRSMRRNCEICNQTFSSRKNLKKHLKIVHADTVLAVPQTRKKCKMKPVVNDGIISNKDALVGGPLLDNILNDSLDNSNMLLSTSELNQFDINLANNLDSQNMELETDNLNLSVDNLLNDNVKQLVDFNFEIDECQEQYVCDICLKVFSKLQNLTTHMKKHTGKYTCEKCLTIFCRKENLMLHQCNNNQLYTCKFCDKTFRARKYLMRHIKDSHSTHSTCGTCQKAYSSFWEMKCHNCPLVPDDQKPKFACPVCSKVFLHEVYLKRHAKTHTDKQKSDSLVTCICDICAQQFRSKKSLNVHMQTHSEPAYACEVCDKKFYKKTILTNHMVMHNKKEVKCTKCAKVFMTKKGLKMHMAQHSEKRFECDECGTKFFQRPNLLKHVAKRHAKMCTVCKQHFGTDFELQQHGLTHFKNYYSCPLCYKKMKLRQSLLRHINASHANQKHLINIENVKPLEFDMESLLDVKNKTASTNNKAEDTRENTSDPLNSIQFNNIDTYSKDQSISDNIDNIVNNFSNIMDNYQQNNTGSYIQDNGHGANLNSGSSIDMAASNTFKEKSDIPVLDFNDLTMDYDTNFGLQPSSIEENRDVCLSMPDLTDADLEITLGKNAYILDNGTIVEQQEPGNYLVYVLQQKFLDNIDIPSNNQ